MHNRSLEFIYLYLGLRVLEMSGSQQHYKMLIQNAMGCFHCGVHRCLSQHLQAAWHVTTLTYRSALATGKIIM
jgi:hypothetical protein